MQSGSPTFLKADDTDGKRHLGQVKLQTKYFSRYLEKVIVSGKAVYTIPMYANVWLNLDSLDAVDRSYTMFMTPTSIIAGGSGPGDYPSGGPCAHVMDVWRFGAPYLGLIAPDLHFHDYEMVCKDYTDKETRSLSPSRDVMSMALVGYG